MPSLRARARALFGGCALLTRAWQVHSELRGRLSFQVLTDYLVLAPSVGSSVYISITSLDRTRSNGRCIATVLYLCEVRFEGSLLSRFFRLHKQRWMSRDGSVELETRDVIQVRTARVSSGEGGISIALDVEAMDTEMELIKPDGAVYMLSSAGEASMRQFLPPEPASLDSFLKPLTPAKRHQNGVDGSASTTPATPAPAAAATAAETTPSQDTATPTSRPANEVLTITLIIPALYNARIAIEVKAADTLRIVRSRVARECQLAPDALVVTDLVLVRAASSLRIGDTFSQSGVVSGGTYGRARVSFFSHGSHRRLYYCQD